MEQEQGYEPQEDKKVSKVINTFREDENGNSLEYKNVKYKNIEDIKLEPGVYQLSGSGGAACVEIRPGGEVYEPTNSDEQEELWKIWENENSKNK